jgi:cell division protein FtsQ
MPSRTRERSDAPASVQRSRRAFARRQWARRWLAWKYVVAALLLLALVVGGVWLVFFSQVLAVKQVEVVGADQLSVETVRAAGGDLDGEQLARLDLPGLEKRIESLAEVREAEVTRRWPDTVRIVVEERVAIAVVEIGPDLRGLDAEGAVFDRYRQPPDGLPRVETALDAGRDALREAAAVVAALPADLARKVDHVEVATVDQISLVLRDERIVMWGSADQSDLKAEVLGPLLARAGQTYDVSVPGQATVRP